MTRRWLCPRCASGLLAPSRPRLDDVRRYCLPCSQTSGRLVERTCPAREAESSRHRELRAARLAARHERAAAIEATYPWCLRGLFDQWRNLTAWGRPLVHAHLLLRRSTSKVASSGHAWPTGRITMTAGSDEADARATVLHELAHVAAPRACQHGSRWRHLLLAAAMEVVGRPVIAPGAGLHAVHGAVAAAFREGVA